MKEPVNILFQSFLAGNLSVVDLVNKMKEHKHENEEQNIWLSICDEGSDGNIFLEVIQGEDDVLHQTHITKEEYEEFKNLGVVEV